MLAAAALGQDDVNPEASLTDHLALPSTLQPAGYCHQRTLSALSQQQLSRDIERDVLQASALLHHRSPDPQRLAQKRLLSNSTASATALLR